MIILRTENEIIQQINHFRNIQKVMEQDSPTLEDERRIKLLFNTAISTLLWVLSEDNNTPLNVTMQDIDNAVKKLQQIVEDKKENKNGREKDSD